MIEDRLSLRVFLVTLLLAFSLSLSLAASETGFLERSVNVEGVDYRYQVFVPKDWTPDKEWPVILFLHGAGERGDDGVEQTQVGFPRTLKGKNDFPAVVVMPQCRRRTWWGDPAMEAQTFAALEETMSRFNGDPRRIYLTGLSLGGYGTWAFGYKYPKKFAALVPVCGGVRTGRSVTVPRWHPAADPSVDAYQETAREIGTTPVWAFHGSSDPVVPVTESRQLTRALENSGGTVKYTEYEGVGHNSWDRAYSEPDLIDWLLAQTLASGPK